MAKFEITLKNTKAKQYYSMSIFIVLLNIGVFILTVFYSAEKNIRALAMIGAILSAIALCIEFVLRRKNDKLSKWSFYPLFIVAVTWSMIGSLWLFLLGFVLMFMYAISQRRLMVRVTKETVLYPSFPPKQVQWSELNNIVLKDGLLTIDFKNDKVLQSEIIESSAGLNEQEFNEFCREQLKES